MKEKGKGREGREKKEKGKRKEGKKREGKGKKGKENGKTDLEKRKERKGRKMREGKGYGSQGKVAACKTFSPGGTIKLFLTQTSNLIYRHVTSQHNSPGINASMNCKQVRFIYGQVTSPHPSPTGKFIRDASRQVR